MHVKKVNKASGIIAMSAVVLIYSISYIAREAIGKALTAPQVLTIQMAIMAIFFGL